MVAEILNFKIDSDKLLAHFQKFVLPLPSVGNPTMFGGWSVLSSDGHYQDGWHSGHISEDRKLTVEEQRIALAEATKQRKKTSRDYCNPTEICHSYMRELIDQLIDQKLYPSRARIIRLCANTVTFKHRDHTDNAYAVRLHIPIITNEFCTFDIEGESMHFPADGSLYLVHVNRIHWACNRGTTDRYQLVIDVRDIDNRTISHRYDKALYPDTPYIRELVPTYSWREPQLATAE